ncbi:glycosyltransferase [Vagococcus teuberi]
MYYRLLCGDILPKTIKHVLYLDPDILILNSLEELW